MNGDFMIENLAVIVWYLIICLRIFAKLCLSLLVVLFLYLAIKTLSKGERKGE